MTVEDLLAAALGLPGAWLDHPWGPEDRVVKVGSRIFLFAGSEGEAEAVTVRAADLESTAVWRERYPAAVGPAPYLRGKPWNRVLVAGGGLPDDELLDLLEESYAAVVARLPKRERPAG